MDDPTNAGRMGLTIGGHDLTNAGTVAAALGISKAAAIRWALGVAAVVSREPDAAKCRKGEDAAEVFASVNRGAASAAPNAPK